MMFEELGIVAMSERLSEAWRFRFTEGYWGIMLRERFVRCGDVKMNYDTRLCVAV